MNKLTDTQLVILTAACARPDRLILPLPAHIKGGAVGKVVTGLLSRGLVEEVDAGRDAPVWRETGDGCGMTLVATDAAFAALGIEPAAEPENTVAHRCDAGTNSAGEPAVGATAEADTGTVEAALETPVGLSTVAATARAKAPARRTRDGTKQAQLIAMLGRKEGATIAQIVEATGWRRHTVRGAFAGALKKRLGLTVTSEKIEGGERTYRIV